ncbi:hypothetical protein [Cecembia rubra]|uniref:Uncharacterized protein n=1 Tax=Cecembia rubra TaxID=1485585 RepID=A0A2P8DYE8_9BACT|nr:hypothetical protein [Cecembia rubra]PSL02244.1 hypothetical protein CLV48_11026 [Cecembia rubra]
MYYIQGTDRFQLTFSSLDDVVDNVNPVRIIEDFINKLDKDFLRFVHILRQKDQQNQKRTVEPVLGTLINFLNMRKINSRGMEQANKSRKCGSGSNL